MQKKFARLTPESYRNALVPRLRNRLETLRETLRKKLLGDPPMDDSPADSGTPTPTAGEELQK